MKFRRASEESKNLKNELSRKKTKRQPYKTPKNYSNNSDLAQRRKLDVKKSKKLKLENG